ncbi:MAG: peptidylprolyl isomerase [Candidatus Moranbacteria bacterium]|nr:peptidylprolyl isomerase [Candidatus Moranbacteria bacterium]
MRKTNKKRHLRMLVIVIAASASIFAVLLFFILGVYKYNWNNRMMQAAEKIIPFPAVYVRGAGLISISEVKEDKKAVQKFYESQDFDKLGMRIDFSTDQGQQRLAVKEKGILNKLIENRMIESLAKKRGIVINDATADEAVNSSLSQFGNRQNLMSDLARLYGWTLDDFKQKVVKPELYTEKLAEAFSSETDTGVQESKIKSLHERVTTKKEDFAKVAKESSEGQSAQNSGDLGWSTKEQLITEIADKAFSMKPGEISEAISSPLGFHIIKLEEKKSDSGQDLVHLRQIFVKIPTFSDWLKDQMKKYNVMVLLRDYQWNSGEAQIEFKNQDLKKFEENLDINSQGDPSIF